MLKALHHFNNLTRTYTLPHIPTAKASKRLMNTITWRETSLPNPMICSHCAKDYKSHFMHPVGHDKLGRPVIYSVFSLANNTKTQDNVQHMVSTCNLVDTRTTETMDSAPGNNC